MSSSLETRIVELRKDGFSYARIAEILSERDGQPYTKDALQKIGQKAFKAETDATRTDRIRQWIGDSLEVSAPEPVTSGTRKIFALGDVHGTIDPKILSTILMESPDLIVIGGDIMDQAAQSTHDPYPGQKYPNIRDEIASARAWLGILRSRLPNTEIVIMRGNHDDRVIRRLKEVPEDLRDLISDPFDLIVNGLNGVRLNKQELFFDRPYNSQPQPMAISEYLYVIGDVLISHGNFLSAEKLAQRIDEWKKPLGLPDLSVYIQFHTHHWRHIIDQGGWRHLIEPGMAGVAATEAYKLASHNIKWKPGVLGCIVFSQDLNADMDWVTIPSSIHPVYF